MLPYLFQDLLAVNAAERLYVDRRMIAGQNAHAFFPVTGSQMLMYDAHKSAVRFVLHDQESDSLMTFKREYS